MYVCINLKCTGEKKIILLNKFEYQNGIELLRLRLTF